MNLLSPTTIKQILTKYNAKPSRGLGQNFLIDSHVLDKIIEAADTKSDDVILEVGPGIGTLTQKLATRLRPASPKLQRGEQGYGEAKEKAGRVIAVEKDQTMVEILKETLKDFKNIEVIQGDILKTNFQFSIFNFQSNSNDSISKKYKVVANIPYYITSPLIRVLLESENPPESIVLLVQKEVAQRICSNPPDMSLLAVSVQFYAEPKIISYVSKNCFWPAPKIDSAIIKIVPRSPTSRPTGGRTSLSPDLFFKVVKAGFSQPRKQLVNNLTTLKASNGVKLTKDQISDWLSENNIKTNQRSETLSVFDWIKLAKSFKKI